MNALKGHGDNCRYLVDQMAETMNCATRENWLSFTELGVSSQTDDALYANKSVRYEPQRAGEEE
jgi:hypothetical protein